MSCQKKASLRLPERKNALGGGRKVSASVCRLNFCVICRAPTRALNGRSAAARPVAIRCGCWVRIRPALGGRADGRALPGWYPSSPAAMCRQSDWRRVVVAIRTFLRYHFPFESHGRATPTALSPSGEKPRHPIAPLIKGSWRRRRLRGQPLKKRPGIHRIPGLHTYYPITYYLLPRSVPAHQLAVFGVEHYRAPGGEVAAEDFAGLLASRRCSGGSGGAGARP